MSHGRTRCSDTPSDEEILAQDYVLPEMAAKYIKVNTNTIRYALQQGRAPFGFAAQNPSTGTWTYNISPGGLVKYKREGRPMINLADLREMLADSAKEVLDAKMQSLSRVVEAVMGA